MLIYRNGRHFHWGVVAVFASALLVSPSAGAADSLRTLVRPIPPEVLAPPSPSQASAELIQAYYDSILQWGRVVARQVRPVPGRQGESYLGLPQNVEDDVRPTAYAAMVLGFLAEYRPPRPGVEPSQRQAWRASAIGLLRYLTASHVSSGGACLNGKPWGNQWQSAMWARAAGMAGWFLWDDLDQDLQAAVARLIEFEADRFPKKEPKSSLRNDTGAEENAWNSQITALACNMMPAHPHAKAWEEASLRYMYNSFSVAADARDATPGDGGRPLKDWVTTVNAHDDFTVENHGIVHMGYLKTTASELQENVLPWLLTGRNTPAACMHHVPEALELLIHCMAWDGAPVYFSGTDWKSYHEQSCEIVLYTMQSLLKGDRRAAFLEQTALKWLARQQRAEKGFYNVRRDLEYGGLCATRLIACCLAHGIIDAPPKPISADEFDRLAAGTRHLIAGKTVVHRTPNKFASFTWAQKRMALALPRNGTWVLWPHFDSYLGILDGRDSSHRNARLEKIDVDVRPNGFTVSGRLLRCKGKLVQDFFYASPPGDFTVYIERLQPAKDFRPGSRETGVIGLAYPLGSNERTLYGPWDSLQTRGYGGRAAIHCLAGDWLNIDNRAGYVVRRTDGRRNVIRYHDESRGFGRVPQLQEWISLVGDADPLPSAAPTWACVVTFLNQSAQDTKQWSSRVQFSAEDRQATCTVGKETFTADFSPNQEPEKK
ncbi:MAG: hypothetical protein JXB10_08290 [Pirellulales bacterium]|nr:hypothetical protein [Pirellulales bacterium]